MSSRQRGMRKGFQKRYGKVPQVLAAHQPNFMPWVGYWFKFYSVTHFVHLTAAQFSKGQFQNRSQYEVDGEERWLTVPVKTKGRLGQPIREVEINNDIDWRRKHMATIEQMFYDPDDASHGEPMSRLHRLYSYPWKNLSEFNLAIINEMITQNARTVRTPAVYADVNILNNQPETDPNAKLIALCQTLGCTEYLAGPTGREYMDLGMFKEAGIRVHFAPTVEEVRGDLGEEAPSSNFCLNNLFQVDPNDDLDELEVD